MRPRALLAASAAAVLLLLPGCFDQLLEPPGSTTRAFACAVLDPGVALQVVIESWLQPGPLEEAVVQEALSGLWSALAWGTGRPAGAFRIQERGLEGVPEWQPEGLERWAAGRGFLEDRVATLRILWVADLEGDLSGHNAAPGIVAVSQGAVLRGAEALGVPAQDVARAVLLHYVGHALGEVNNGIPVQDPSIEEREGPAKHEPDPASVLSVAWHQPGTMAWAPGAAYDGWSQGVRLDWAAAQAAGGACA